MLMAWTSNQSDSGNSESRRLRWILGRGEGLRGWSGLDRRATSLADRDRGDLGHAAAEGPAEEGATVEDELLHHCSTFTCENAGLAAISTRRSCIE